MCLGEHPYIPVDRVAKLEMIYRQDEQVVVNVFHYMSDQGWTAERLAELCDEAKVIFDNLLKPNYPAIYSLRTIKATDLTSQTGPTAERDYVPPVFGTDITNDPMPNNVTVCTKWVTAQRGRSYRGRTFHPCLTAIQVAGNSLSETGVTDVAGYSGAMLGTMAGFQWWLMVVSYCHDKAWRTTGVATRVTEFSLNEVLDSQRRRLPERGR